MAAAELPAPDDPSSYTPLVIDVVDTWNSKSIGGCTYHVMHPGGRSYATFPVNSYEAESRRLGRFFRHGHSAGTVHPRLPERSREFPFTLDLRAVRAACGSV